MCIVCVSIGHGCLFDELIRGLMWWGSVEQLSAAVLQLSAAGNLWPRRFPTQGTAQCGSGPSVLESRWFRCLCVRVRDGEFWA